jgi:hypothetical protein
MGLIGQQVQQFLLRALEAGVDDLGGLVDRLLVLALAL